MQWTPMALLTRTLEADGEVVWSRHQSWCQVCGSRAARTTVAKARLTEEIAYKP